MATITEQIFENNPLTYGATLSEPNDRLDCAWFNPVVENRIESLKKNKKNNRKLVQLKNVADVDGGKRLPKGTVVLESESSIIPYVRATDVKNLKVNLDTAVKINKETHQVIQNYQLKQNDVIVTIVGTIGEVGILEEDVEVCDFTENVARVRVNKNSVHPRFLLHFLDSEFGKMQADRFSVGALQYKLSLKSCRNIEVYLPFSNDSFDANEQKKILDKIHSIFEQVEKKRKKVKALLGDARNVVVKKIGLPIIDTLENNWSFERIIDNDPFSRLDTLFNNPLRYKLLNILEKYPNKSLGELTKPQTINKIIPKDFYRLIELEQIDEDTGRITNVNEVPELGSKKILLKEGSILISKLQPDKGKIAIVNKEYDGCVGSSELVPLVLDSPEISLEYLWAVLRSKYVLKQWEYELTGSSRMRIGPNEIKNTVIPIPNRKIQNEIVKKIKDYITKSDEVLEEADKLLTRTRKQFVELLIK